MQGEIEDSEHVKLAAQASTLLQHLDIPPTAASLVGLLLVSEPSGVTHQQLLERLGVSKAAVSGAVRYLEALDLAHYVPVSGTRRRLLRLQPAHLITYLRRRMTHFAGLTATLRSIASARGDQETFTRQIASVAELCARLNDSVNEILDEWEREQR